MTTFTSEDRILAQKDIDLEEVILALKAAGFAAPEYEILPDGSTHFFYGQKNIDTPVSFKEPGDKNI
jgi:hypothetical protein